MWRPHADDERDGGDDAHVDGDVHDADDVDGGGHDGRANVHADGGHVDDASAHGVRPLLRRHDVPRRQRHAQRVRVWDVW